MLIISPRKDFEIFMIYFVDENKGKTISYNTLKKFTDELGYFFGDGTVK
jgi:hypothetical protein